MLLRATSLRHGRYGPCVSDSNGVEVVLLQSRILKSECELLGFAVMNPTLSKTFRWIGIGLSGRVVVIVLVPGQIHDRNVLIKVKGDIDLGPEELNPEINGDPKKIRFTRLRNPIVVKGHLMKPSIGVDVRSTAKQGGDRRRRVRIFHLQIVHPRTSRLTQQTRPPRNCDRSSAKVIACGDPCRGR